MTSAARCSPGKAPEKRAPGQYLELKIIILGKKMLLNDWTDFLLDATPLKSIFGSRPPTLNDVDLHEIILNCDGPNVLLRFDVSSFPELPPKKWSAEGFNKVQLRLLAIGVQDFQMTGLQSNVKLDIKIYKKESLLFLHADNGSMKLDFLSKFLFLEKVSAYHELENK